MSELIAVSNSSFQVKVTPLAAGSQIIATPNLGVHNPSTPAYFGINDVGKTKDPNCKSGGDNFLVDEVTQKSGPAPAGTADDFNCGVLTPGVKSWSSKGSFVIPSTAKKVKGSGIKFMRKGDSTIVNCTCSGFNNVTPPPSGTAFTGSCQIEISTAGQTVVRGK